MALVSLRSSRWRICLPLTLSLTLWLALGLALALGLSLQLGQQRLKVEAGLLLLKGLDRLRLHVLESLHLHRHALNRLILGRAILLRLQPLVLPLNDSDLLRDNLNKKRHVSS